MMTITKCAHDFLLTRVCKWDFDRCDVCVSVIICIHFRFFDDNDNFPLNWTHNSIMFYTLSLWYWYARVSGVVSLFEYNSYQRTTTATATTKILTKKVESIVKKKLWKIDKMFLLPCRTTYPIEFGVWKEQQKKRKKII